LQVNLPNSITLIRICSIPLLIWVLSSSRFSSVHGEKELLASALFIAASITDGIDGYIARKRGQIKTMKEGVEKERLQAVEKTKASVRAFVEHPFHIVKNLFRHRKVRYRGLAKNGHQLYTLFGLANVVIGARAVTA